METVINDLFLMMIFHVKMLAVNMLLLSYSTSVQIKICMKYR